MSLQNWTKTYSLLKEFKRMCQKMLKNLSSSMFTWNLTGAFAKNSRITGRTSWSNLNFSENRRRSRFKRISSNWSWIGADMVILPMIICILRLEIHTTQLALISTCWTLKMPTEWACHHHSNPRPHRTTSQLVHPALPWDKTGKRSLWTLFHTTVRSMCTFRAMRQEMPHNTSRLKPLKNWDDKKLTQGTWLKSQASMSQEVNLECHHGQRKTSLQWTRAQTHTTASTLTRRRAASWKPKWWRPTATRLQKAKKYPLKKLMKPSE